MAGWEALMQGFQYHEPVAPVVPQPDNTAAKIISANTDTAVNAFLRAASIRKQADLEEKRMVLDAGVNAARMGLEDRRLDLEGKRIANDYELTKRGQDLSYDAHLQDDQVRWSEMKLRNDLYDYERKRKLNGIEAVRKYALSVSNIIDEAGQVSDKLKLFDPNFRMQHPMQWTANLIGFEKMYGDAPDDSRIPATIKQLKAEADKQSVPLKVGGKTTPYPWSQVVRDLLQNGDNSPFYQPLLEGGFFKTHLSTMKVGKDTPVWPPSATDTESTDIPLTVREPAGILAAMMKDAQGADFTSAEGQKSRIPPHLPRSSTQAKLFAEDVTLPESVTGEPTGTATKSGQLNPGADIPPPERTPIQSEADYVKKLIQAHPEKKDELKGMFFQKHPDADPGSLDDEVAQGASFP